jgi:hypothetical protein
MNCSDLKEIEKGGRRGRGGERSDSRKDKYKGWLDRHEYVYTWHV